MTEGRGLRAGCKYHFNIMYNHEDRIHRQTPDTKLSHKFTVAVVNKLEKKGYVKSYYHDRDAIPGRSILTEHFRVIETSGKTIFIITQEFVQNEWRTYLSHSAIKVLLDSKTNHRLIPLILNLQRDAPQEFLAHSPVYFPHNWEDDSCTNSWERLFKAMESDDVNEELTPDLEAEGGPHPKDNDDRLRGEYSDNLITQPSSTRQSSVIPLSSQSESGSYWYNNALMDGKKGEEEEEEEEKEDEEEVCDGIPTTRCVHVHTTHSVSPDQRNVVSSSKPARAINTAECTTSRCTGPRSKQAQSMLVRGADRPNFTSFRSLPAGTPSQLQFHNDRDAMKSVALPSPSHMTSTSRTLRSNTFPTDGLEKNVSDRETETKHTSTHGSNYHSVPSQMYHMPQSKPHRPEDTRSSYASAILVTDTHSAEYDGGLWVDSAGPPVSQPGYYTSPTPTRTENYRQDGPSNEGPHAEHMEFFLGSDMDDTSAQRPDIMTVSPVRRRVTETSYIGEGNKQDTRDTDDSHERRQHGHSTDSKTAEKATEDSTNMYSCGERRGSREPEGEGGEGSFFANIFPSIHGGLRYLLSKTWQALNSLE